MIVVTGSVTARPDSFDEVKRLSLEHVHRSRTEPGCISHAVHVDCENPLRLVFFEQWADRAALPSLPDDEFYHADLIGLEVADPGGAVLGRVRAVYDHGAGDILEVAGPAGVLLIPFTRAAVPTVDLAAGRIVADPPESDE